MRRRKSLVAFALLMATIMLLATACGCQPESGDSSSKNSQAAGSTNEKESTKDNVQNASSQKTASTDFAPTKSLEERRAVKRDDYIKDGRFDLTAYAEALGYTRLENPESPGAVMYAIERDGGKYFFVFSSSTAIVYADIGDGYIYRTSPNTTSVKPVDIVIASMGQADQGTSWRGFEYLVVPLEHLAKADSVSINYFPGFSLITKYEGPVQYYPNGMIKYKEAKKDIETIECHGLNF